jgi:AcrR family transcriptional regulator
MSRFISTSLCPVRAKHERRKEARPGELIQAALELFVEKGFAATRSEEVAMRAGVSKGTLFLYFPSKTELFKAVIAETLAGRFSEWNAEFERFEGTTADMLRHCLDVWWELVGATPASGITKLMMTEGNNFPELAAYYRREVVEPGHALIRRILRRGIDCGEFRAVDVDHASYAVVSTMAMLTLMRHSPGSCIDSSVAIDPRRYLSVQTDLLIGGLVATPIKIADSLRAPAARKETP